MSKLIRRMGKGNKGMEALQAVILVGVAFFILWGVQKIWKDVQPQFNTEVSNTIKGNGQAVQNGSGG